jgi:hydroxyethylthiazole kinase
MKQRISELLKKTREENPLVHHITNAVTINDCANATLAAGGSPVMADAIEEVEEMTSISSALVINFGTIKKEALAAMEKAMKKANEKGIPVIFDPVGVGATTYRTKSAQWLLEQVKVTVIRGNVSEVASLIGVEAKTSGVDAGEVGEDKTTIAKKTAKKYNTVVVISGEIDVITDGERVVYVENGHQMLTRVSGTGCMIGCFVGASGSVLEGAIAGISYMGLAGERAVKRLKEGEGVGTFKINLFDELSTLKSTTWEKEVKMYEAKQPIL